MLMMMSQVKHFLISSKIQKFKYRKRETGVYLKGYNGGAAFKSFYATVPLVQLLKTFW